MNPAASAILAELNRTSAPRTVSDLVALCELTRAAVERALGELAVGGAVERVLIERSEWLNAAWRRRGTRTRAVRDDEDLT